MSALPLQSTFHHAAVVVSDLDRSIDFYTRFFGGEVEVIRDISGPDMASLHGLEDAQFDLAFLRYGDARIELLHFHEPPGAGSGRPVAAHEIGAAHVAFEVDDVGLAFDRLGAAGIAFSRPPLRVEEGHGAGYVLAFLNDPDGNRIELVAPPRAASPAPQRPAKVIEVSVAEGRREAFLELMLPVVAASAEESGAEEFTLHQLDGDECRFWIYERYRDDEAAHVHEQQPQLRALLAAMGPLLAGPPQIFELRTLAPA